MLKNQSLQNGLKLVPLNQINPPDCQNIKFDHIQSDLNIQVSQIRYFHDQKRF
jgi:hypothetical protein